MLFDRERRREKDGTSPADAVECCGKRAELQVALDPADAVVLREGLLLPFTIRVDTIAAAPAAKPEETP